MRTFIFLTLFFAFCLHGCGQKPLNLNNNGASIVAFGDSLTYGYGAGEAGSYPYFLGQMLKQSVINLGVSGNTAADGAARKAEIAEHRPYMVLIEFGGNDAMRGRAFTQTQNALVEIVDYVQKLGAIAVIVDTGGNFKMNPYSKMMKKLAKEKRAVFVPAIMDGIFYKPDLKSDAIHPNEKGYKIIADKIYKEIKPYLKK